MRRAVLLTGSTGFHGKAILSALRSNPWGELSLLVRSGSRVDDAGLGRIRMGDIRHPGAVRAALAGIDTIVHSASYVGYDRQLCHQVNVEGTEILIDEARRAGVANIVYVSTTGVYGSGPHSGLSERQMTPAPESELSLSRLAAEGLVAEYGGTVVRPGYVYGAGDQWVIPSVVHMTNALGARVEEGRADLSVIRVDDLGRLIARIAENLPTLSPRRVFHAANVAPVNVGTILSGLASGIGFPLPTRSIGVEDARARAESAGLSVRQLSPLMFDHWYESSAIWDAAGLTSPSGFSLRPHEAAWYRSACAKDLDHPNDIKTK